MELGGRSRSARRCRRARGSRSPRRILCSRAVPNPFSTALVAEHSAANFELSRVPTETFSPQMYYRDNRDTQVLVLTRAPRLRELERLPKPRRGRLRRGGSSRVARGRLREGSAGPAPRRQGRPCCPWPLRVFALGAFAPPSAGWYVEPCGTSAENGPPRAGIRP